MAGQINESERVVGQGNTISLVLSPCLAEDGCRNRGEIMRPPFTIMAYYHVGMTPKRMAATLKVHK